MKKYFAILLLMIGASSSSATSLSEIVEFSKGVCDEISTEGSIRREEIEGKISGKLNGIARLIGASIGADGSIKIDDTKYKGIPYSDLPAQMSDARSCRKELTMILLKERQEVERVQATKINQTSEKANKCLISFSCEQSKMEGLCQCREVVEEISQEKGFSEAQQSKTYFKTCGKELSGIKQCWGSDRDLDLQRSECDSVLKIAGISQPEIPSDSCLGKNK